MKRIVVVSTYAAALAVCFAWAAPQASAKTVRFHGTNGEELAQLLSREGEETTVEFRAGDKLPVRIVASGDIIQSTAPTSAPEMIEVRQTFYLRLANDILLLSWDGQTYAPLTEQIKGSLSANAGSRGIEIQLEARRD